MTKKKNCPECKLFAKFEFMKLIDQKIYQLLIGLNMIKKFDASTAMLLVDVQKGVNDTSYYGGSKGRRNNLNAENNIIHILTEWRLSDRQVAFTKRNIQF